eukprot:13759114-Alexandrium_andersonii.AAC.1
MSWKREDTGGGQAVPASDCRHSPHQSLLTRALLHERRNSATARTRLLCAHQAAGRASARACPR